MNYEQDRDGPSHEVLHVAHGSISDWTQQFATAWA